MIAAASGQLAELIETLALVARIEAGRYQPTIQRIDSLRLGRVAGDRLGGTLDVSGHGEAVTVDVAAAERALAALAECARRHGGVERIGLHVEGADVVLSPVTAEAAPVIMGESLRDLGAAAARVLIEALGGSLALQDETLVVSLPTSADATADGP